MLGVPCKRVTLFSQRQKFSEEAGQNMLAQNTAVCFKILCGHLRGRHKKLSPNFFCLCNIRNNRKNRGPRGVRTACFIQSSPGCCSSSIPHFAEQRYSWPFPCVNFEMSTGSYWMLLWIRLVSHLLSYSYALVSGTLRTEKHNFPPLQEAFRQVWPNWRWPVTWILVFLTFLVSSLFYYHLILTILVKYILLM